MVFEIRRPFQSLRFMIQPASRRRTGFVPALLASAGLFVGLLTCLPGCGPSAGGGGGSGSTGRLVIRNIAWGRLVDVVDRNNVLVRTDYVVGDDIISDGQSFVLSYNPVTEKATVQILLAEGDPGFENLFARLTSGLGTVQVKGLASIPPFSLVPRNAAMRIQFTGHVDPSTVDNTTVQLFSGVPPSTPLQVRYIVDPVEPELLVLDPTISIFDQVATGLPVNSTGMPPSVDTSTPNITLRIPTQVNQGAGQPYILLSASGSPVQSTGNGPTDPSQPSTLLRVLRSGNQADTNRGFLLDLAAPRLLGEQPIQILAQLPTQLAYEFDVAACAVSPVIGDVIQQGQLAAEVIEILDGTAPDFLVNVRRLDSSSAAFSLIQRAQYVSPYDEGTDTIACYVRFTPDATNMLTTGVNPSASISLRFSEAMDPTTISPFDSMSVSRNGVLANLGFRDYAVGEVVPASDNRRFTFSPASPGLNHDNGVAENYFLHLRTDPSSPLSMRDLAGNALDFPDTAIGFSLLASAPTVRVDGFAMRFGQQNEDNTPPAPVAPLLGSEWRGQFIADPVRAFVQGRPVSRFSVAVDPGQPVLASKAASTLPERTPLVPLGARLMTVWRYVDMGLTFADEAGYNIDVAGLNWAPFGGQISSDVFPAMQIHLGHSQYSPDETAVMGVLTFPNSGLRPTSFAGNVLNQTALERVYEGPYSINNLNAFLVPGTDTPMLPWPAFRDPSGEPISFTWRDTNVSALAAPDGGGVDPSVLNVVYGIPTVIYAAAGAVPTVGLPLLMDFRVPPDSGSTARGLNNFQVSFSDPAAQKPNFRVFSAGGFNAQNTSVQVDINSDIAFGGFAGGGTPTPPDDSAIYWGQADFVIRVSRGITRWIDTQVTDPTGTFPAYQSPVIEPLASEQPPGTSFQLDFRAADNVVANATQLTHAECVNLYGDPISTNITPGCTPNTPATGITSWTNALNSLNGRRFLQMRFTLVSNVSTGAVASISSVGIGWNRLP